jgi:cytochrome c oxidase subunit II
MALALALVFIVIGALVFHFVSPWWLTPLASNWQQMDDALLITLIICALAFAAVNLFIAYAVIRFRHRDGRRASHEHGNRRLEWALIGLTTVGIVAMLAPGLSVYAKLISPPNDALVFEVLGQQWQWHYRLPGKDGKLGVTDMRFVSADNPFGMNPADPNGQDDVLVKGQEMHIPLQHPVKVLLRSKDVLHDFYVPQFRTRMNMVPGMVTSFWFTPTRTGKFEVMCAQLCGVGHYNMRSDVVVDELPVYQAWLKDQPTFASIQLAAQGVGQAGTAPGSDLARQGQLLAQARGCVACHSVDGSAGVGPTWRGLYGKTETLADAKTVLADDAYLKESIVDPKARIVHGFAPIMPQQTFSEQELAGLVGYIKSLK